MKNFFTTKTICRAAVIAALYTALTWAFGALSYMPFGLIEIRPAEALCILPLFFPEAIPGLYVGCILANLFSGFGAYDVWLGSLATLLAALATWGVGKMIKNDVLKVIVGGFFPVILNAAFIPVVIWLGSGMEELTYWALFIEIGVSEAIWVYALGSLLYVALRRLRERKVSVLL